MKNSFVLATLAIFVILSVAIYFLKTDIPAFDLVGLEVGNGLLAALCLGSYLMVKKQMNDRPQAFVRGVYSATFLKLMVCMVAILVYILVNRANLYKANIFVLFGIYFIYTVMETRILFKMVRGK